MNGKFTIRRFAPADAGAVQKLIHRGPREINGKDYPEKRVEAAPSSAFFSRGAVFRFFRGLPLTAITFILVTLMFNHLALAGVISGCEPLLHRRG